MTKTCKELYITTITHDSISRIFKVFNNKEINHTQYVKMSEKSNGFAFEYSTSSDSSHSTLVFSTVDFRNFILNKYNLYSIAATIFK